VDIPDLVPATEDGFGSDPFGVIHFSPLACHSTYSRMPRSLCAGVFSVNCGSTSTGTGGGMMHSSFATRRRGFVRVGFGLRLVRGIEAPRVGGGDAARVAPPARVERNDKLFGGAPGPHARDDEPEADAADVLARLDEEAEEDGDEDGGE
jgi:hypothetical protein